MAKIKTKLLTDGLDYAIEYNEETDEVWIGYADDDGNIVADDYDDDLIVLSLQSYLRLTSAFKSEMLANGLGHKVKGY